MSNVVPMASGGDARSLPHNIQAEQGFLGAIMLNNQHLGGVQHWLRPEDFFDPIHQQVYESARSYFRKNVIADPITLAPAFEGISISDDITVGQYLGSLVAKSAAGISVVSYAQSIKELSRRRELMLMSEWLEAQIERADCDTDAVAAHLLGDLDEWLREGQHTKRTRFDVDAMIDAALAEEAAGDTIPTGLIDLDRKLGGYSRGELTIIGARPSMGKSMVASSTAIRIAMAGEGVCFFSLEMKTRDIGRRIVSDLSWSKTAPIPYADIPKPDGLVQFERDRLLDAAQKLQNIPWMVDEQAGLTVAEIASRARNQAKAFEESGHRLSLVVVDHVGKVRATKSRNGNLVQETRDIVGDLAQMAKDLDVAVLALCQLNRGVEGRDEKRPTLADLKWSGAAEEDADAVMFLYRPAYYLERASHNDDEKEATRLEAVEATKHDLEIIVAKQRNGPLGTVKAFCAPECNVVRDRATGW